MHKFFVFVSSYLALGSFRFAGRCGLAPGIGGGGFAKVGRLSSAEGPIEAMYVLLISFECEVSGFI